MGIPVPRVLLGALEGLELVVSWVLLVVGGAASCVVVPIVPLWSRLMLFSADFWLPLWMLTIVVYCCAIR